MTDDTRPTQQRNYTVAELAELAGVTPGRIRQLIADGTIQPTTKRAGARYVSASVAWAWLATRGTERS